MRRKFEQMIRIRRVSLLFATLFLLAVGAFIAIVIILNVGDYNGTNGDFGEYAASGEHESKTYQFNPFSDVYLFSQDSTNNNARTLFTAAVPNVRIINSNRYAVEVKSNKEIFDKLEISLNSNGALVFGFDKKLYGVTYNDDGSYRGLYVECDVFDVTIYAPVDNFRTSAEINLDYDTPKAETIMISVEGEARTGTVKNLNCVNLVASFCGASNVTMSGKVSKMADVSARHNSKIDAQNLECPKLYSLVTCQIFGFSYIDQGGKSHYSITGAGFLIAIILIVAPVFCATMFIVYRVRFLRIRKEIDLYVEKAKSEEKYLKIPEKNEENLLQNDD